MVLYIAVMLYNMSAQYVCWEILLILLPVALENITNYHQTCFQNPWTLHEYLQIYAMNHPLQNFDCGKKKTGELYQAHFGLLFSMSQVEKSLHDLLDSRYVSVASHRVLFSWSWSCFHTHRGTKNVHENNVYTLCLEPVDRSRPNVCLVI